jgi:hypothetical protein
MTPSVSHPWVTTESEYSNILTLLIMWIDIDDDQPDDMEEVLFTHIHVKDLSGNPMKPVVSSGWYEGEMVFRSWLDPRDRFRATHWFRIPPPPQS